MKLTSSWILHASAAFFCSATALGQNGSQTWLQDDNFQRSISVYDPNGHAFVNKYDNVEGSPFLFDDWKMCDIEISGKKFDHCKMKLDLVSQSVHFLTTDGKEMQAQAGVIDHITFSDSSLEPASRYEFLSKLPPIDKHKNSDFYEVLAKGKIMMLKSISKRVVETKNEVSGDIRKEIVTDEDYYFEINGQMIAVKRDKAFILGLMDGGSRAKVESFASANKLGYKSYTDMAKIVSYYNSILG